MHFTFNTLPMHVYGNKLSVCLLELFCNLSKQTQIIKDITAVLRLQVSSHKLTSVYCSVPYGTLLYLLASDQQACPSLLVYTPSKHLVRNSLPFATHPISWKRIHLYKRYGVLVLQFFYTKWPWNVNL